MVMIIVWDNKVHYYFMSSIQYDSESVSVLTLEIYCFLTQPTAGIIKVKLQSLQSVSSLTEPAGSDISNLQKVSDLQSKPQQTQFEVELKYNTTLIKNIFDEMPAKFLICICWWWIVNWMMMILFHDMILTIISLWDLQIIRVFVASFLAELATSHHQ